MHPFLRNCTTISIHIKFFSCKYANLFNSKVKSESSFIITIQPHIVQNIIKPICFIRIHVYWYM